MGRTHRYCYLRRLPSRLLRRWAGLLGLKVSEEYDTRDYLARRITDKEYDCVKDRRRQGT